ncbi:hypothetical protein ACFU8Q_40670 [Streptomyces sp. NPDC057543]|uniref:hypothetical protein n=1 Tax=Streptomyces sp. NPDC057543 TaxID=3346163 RepID=UPI0036CF58C7
MYFGFVGRGSSDDGRERQITTAISPTYAKQILELQEAGATEEDLHPIVAEAITESYFTELGTRAAGLRADFTHVQLRCTASDAARWITPSVIFASSCRRGDHLQHPALLPSPDRRPPRSPLRDGAAAGHRTPGWMRRHRAARDRGPARLRLLPGGDLAMSVEVRIDANRLERALRRPGNAPTSFMAQVLGEAL